MALFFEHQYRTFLCPICKKPEKEGNKCFVMARQKSKSFGDRRKDVICKSTSCCESCYEEIIKYIEGMEEK